MATPSQVVTVTLAAEHWLRIEQALQAAAAVMYRTGKPEQARKYQRSRELIQHVIERWEVKP